MLEPQCPADDIVELYDRIAGDDGVIDAEEFAEGVRKRLRLAVSLRKASTTVQAWWRGILIRVPESVRYAQIRRRQLAGVSASKEIVALARLSTVDRVTSQVRRC